MNDQQDPLQGKTTLGKPTTPLRRPRKRGLVIAMKVFLGSFFAFIALMVLFVLLNRARYKPPVVSGLFAFASLSAFLSCNYLSARLYFKGRTRGRVVEVQRQANLRAPDVYRPRLEYTVEGQAYRVWGTGFRNPPARHAVMDIFYDPADPESATNHIPAWPLTVAVIVLAVAFAVGGVTVLCL